MNVEESAMSLPSPLPELSSTTYGGERQVNGSTYLVWFQWWLAKETLGNDSTIFTKITMLRSVSGY
jgi:hypothetical protein